MHQLLEQVRVEPTLRLFDGDHIHLWPLVLKQQESKDQQAAVGDLSRLIPGVLGPPVLEPEYLLAWLYIGDTVDIRERGDELAELLRERLALTARQRIKDVGEILSIRIEPSRFGNLDWLPHLAEVKSQELV